MPERTTIFSDPSPDQILRVGQLVSDWTVLVPSPHDADPGTPNDPQAIIDADPQRLIWTAGKGSVLQLALWYPDGTGGGITAPVFKVFGVSRGASESVGSVPNAPRRSPLNQQIPWMTLRDQSNDADLTVAIDSANDAKSGDGTMQMTFEVEVDLASCSEIVVMMTTLVVGSSGTKILGKLR